MRPLIHQLSNEQLVAQYATFSYKWLKSNSDDVTFFDYVEELRLEIMRRMQTVDS